MNEFLEVIDEYGHATTAISKGFKRLMDKNESIEIRPVQNGYLVDYSYRLARDGKDGDFDYKYMSEKYIFSNWDDVVKYVGDKKLATPSQR